MLKWIGQHIISIPAIFKSKISLKSIVNANTNTDKNLVLNSTDEVSFRTNDNLADDITGKGTYPFITSVGVLCEDSTYVAKTGVINPSLIMIGGNGIKVTGDNSITITVAGEDATASSKGIVELATTAETTTGTDTIRAVTPDGLKDGYQGSTNITTVGTIGSGEWRGGVINSTYLDTDTAHLTTDQTFTGVKTFDEAINKKSLSYIWTENKFTNTTANEYYFSLTDVERDVPAGSENGVGVVAIMPCTGILKSVVLNTSSNLSGLSWTYKLKKAASGTASTGESLVATVTSTAGGAANTNKVVSFVTNTVDTNVISYESGFSATVMFSAGDRIMFSQQSNSDASGSPKVQATFVLQLDESTIL
tara:strand:+ start:2198 stop:3289 length:1092 start_codon:yes stop_codon:yes gene_type:complete